VSGRSENMRVVNARGRARLSDTYATEAMRKAFARKQRAVAQLKKLGMAPVVPLEKVRDLLEGE
jgi:hypothetical protein